jgi:hypothetical protein
MLKLTQDCAALVLGYYQYSLREKSVGGFIFPWVGEGGGRLIQSRLRVSFFALFGRRRGVPA